MTALPLNMQRLDGIPNQGRYVDERAQPQNLADLIRKMELASDPFGVLRVASEHPIFNITPIQVSVLFDRVITISGTPTVEVVDGEYRVTTAAGEAVRLETGERGRYQPGTIGVPGLGGRRTVAPTGSLTYRFGYFDADRGFGIKEDVDGWHTFVRRDGAEIYSKHRSEWLDPLDGTGPSGLDLPDLDGRILRIPFGWYGYLSIVFGIVMPNKSDRSKSDEFITIDRFTQDGGLTIKEPNLPVSVEVSGDSGGEAFVAGRQFSIFGEPNPRRRVIGELRADQTVNGTFTPLISARIRNSDPWRSIPIQVEGFSLEGDKDLDWYIAIGATVNNSGDANWNISQLSSGDTSTEFNIASTTGSGGEIIAGPAFISAGGGSNINSETISIPAQDVPIGEPATLFARSQSNVATVRSALRVGELR